MNRPRKSSQTSSCSRYGFMPGNGEGITSSLRIRSSRIIVQRSLKLDPLGVEDGPFHAGAAIVPAAGVVADAGYATEADADAAGHGRLQRDLARHARLAAEVGRGFHHLLRPAADDAATGRFAERRAEQVRHQAVVSSGAV